MTFKPLYSQQFSLNCTCYSARVYASLFLAEELTMGSWNNVQTVLGYIVYCWNNVQTVLGYIVYCWNNVQTVLGYIVYCWNNVQTVLGYIVYCFLCYIYILE